MLSIFQHHGCAGETLHRLEYLEWAGLGDAEFGENVMDALRFAKFLDLSVDDLLADSLSHRSETHFPAQGNQWQPPLFA
ncbi:hypothetical protein A5630_04340 [Mycolicibacterium mucogenicum]|uniref:Uncharacterized protein n=1 Tax=Mycolicibacterium mucogenicum TaxID=56689 RepID=A0A1A3GNT9_MYCMU|nr:hypothetical protein A5630_04340 [Mycolicibacterium mucogenicum]